MPDPQASRTVLFRSPAFLGHRTGNHPENPSRMTAIDHELAARGILAERVEPAFAPAPIDAIVRIHEPRLLEDLGMIAGRRGGWIDADTMMAPDSLDVARLASGAAIAAVDAVMD